MQSYGDHFNDQATKHQISTNISSQITLIKDVDN
jgi:hypothetical protein